MTRFDDDMARDLRAAASSADAVHNAFTKYQIACARRDWACAEEHRSVALAAFESQMDNIGAAYMRIEALERTGA